MGDKGAKPAASPFKYSKDRSVKWESVRQVLGEADHSGIGQIVYHACGDGCLSVKLI